MTTSFHIQIISLGVTVSSHKKCLGSHKSPATIISPCVLIWFSVHDGPWELRSRRNREPKGWMVYDSWVGITLLGGGREQGRESSLPVVLNADCSALNYGEAWTHSLHGRFHNSRLKPYTVLSIRLGTTAPGPQNKNQNFRGSFILAQLQFGGSLHEIKE